MYKPWLGWLLEHGNEVLDGHDRYEKIRSEFSRALDRALPRRPLLSISPSARSLTLRPRPSTYSRLFQLDFSYRGSRRAYQAVPRKLCPGHHVSRRVDLSYRRSHNGLFYLISSLVDRLPPRPLSPSRLHRGNGEQEETWPLRGPTDRGMVSWKRIDAIAWLLSRSIVDSNAPRFCDKKSSRHVAFFV